MSSCLVSGGQSGPVIRRLRFEDETEKEAESRYRYRRRTGAAVSGGGARGGSVLPSRPQLRLSANDWVGVEPRGAEPKADVQQRGRTGSGFSPNLLCAPDVRDRGRSLTRSIPSPAPEPIRETYIGHVTFSKTTRGHCHGANLALAPPTTTYLPINPYAYDQPVAVVWPACLAPPTTIRRSSSSSNRQQQRHPIRAELGTGSSPKQ